MINVSLIVATFIVPKITTETMATTTAHPP